MPDEKEHIRAAEFTVVGDNGAERVIMQSGPDEHASLRILDARGKRMAAFTIGGGRGELPGYVGINIFNEESTNIARLGTSAGATSVYLVLNDQQGRPRLRLQVADDGTPSIEMLDADGKATWRAG